MKKKIVSLVALRKIAPEGWRVRELHSVGGDWTICVVGSGAHGSRTPPLHIDVEHHNRQTVRRIARTVLVAVGKEKS